MPSSFIWVATLKRSLKSVQPTNTRRPEDAKSSKEFGGREEGLAVINNVMYCLLLPAYAQGCLSYPPLTHMLESKHSTPVLSLLKMTKRLWRRLEPGGRPMFGLTQNWEEGVMSFHEVIHALSISNPEAIRVAPWRWKGRLNFRRCEWRLCRSGIELQRRCCVECGLSFQSICKQFPTQVWWCNDSKTCWVFRGFEQLSSTIASWVMLQDMLKTGIFTQKYQQRRCL